MSDQEKTPDTAGAPPAETAVAGPARRFVFNGMDLGDIDGSMKPEQVRDFWAGTYPELQNAKVKGPEKDAAGAQVYTFTRSVGHLG
jgi:PRTRC genetic system protein C